MVSAYAFRGIFQRLSQFCGYGTDTSFRNCFWDFQIRERHLAPVKAAGIFEECGITAPSDPGDDVLYDGNYARILLITMAQKRLELRGKTWGAGIKPSEFYFLFAHNAILSSSGWIRSCFIFMAALLTMTRELISAMVSSGTRPFAFKVVPVSIKSTIRSASPRTGASSMEP